MMPKTPVILLNRALMWKALSFSEEAVNRTIADIAKTDSSVNQVPNGSARRFLTIELLDESGSFDFF